MKRKILPEGQTSNLSMGQKKKRTGPVVMLILSTLLHIAPLNHYKIAKHQPNSVNSYDSIAERASGSHPETNLRAPSVVIFDQSQLGDFEPRTEKGRRTLRTK